MATVSVVYQRHVGGLAARMGVLTVLSVDGEWQSWGAWSECSRSCDTGKQHRYRTCRQPQHGGNDCTGDVIDTRHCHLQPCARQSTVEVLFDKYSYC